MEHPQAEENQHTEYVENGYPMTPFAFQTLHDHSAFSSVNNNHLDEKLTLEYNSLLKPENKESVSSKFNLYSNAGRAYISSGQFQNAQKIYELMLDVQPHNEKVMVLLGRCFQVNQEYHKQIHIMKSAIEASEAVKNDPYIWFGIAASFFKIENYTQAEMHFKHCLRVDPHFNLKYQIFLYLGIINKYNLQNKIAIEYFLKNLQDESSQNSEMASLVLVNIGQCLESFQEYNEAASCYNNSLCLIPNNFVALKAISWLFFQNGKISYSQDILKQAVIQNQDRETFYMQARCFEQLGNYKEAMQSINLAIQQEPNNPDNFTVLGVIFNKLNQHMEAFQSFQRAYQMDTSKIENLFNMALIYEVSKKYQEALQLYSKLLLLDPQDCIVLQRRACIESQNYQNLTEYQFQMRFPSFKPSAQIWIENYKQPRFNQLHEVFNGSLDQGVTLIKGEQNSSVSFHKGNIQKKSSLLSQGENNKEIDDFKNMRSLSKSGQFDRKNSIGATTLFQSMPDYQMSKQSIGDGFGQKQFSFNLNNQRSTDNSFNQLEGDTFNQKISNQEQQEGIHVHKQQESPFLGEGTFQSARKNSSIDSIPQEVAFYNRKKKVSSNNELNQCKYGENNGIRSQAFEKKEDNYNYHFSNSPKKDQEKPAYRKESDFSYAQWRKNSYLSNLGGVGGGQYNFSVNSPFNGPIAKDSVDFTFNNNFFGDPLDVNLPLASVNNTSQNINNNNNNHLLTHDYSKYKKNQSMDSYQNGGNANNPQQDVYQ